MSKPPPERCALELVEIALALDRDGLLPNTLTMEEVKYLIVDPVLFPEEHTGDPNGLQQRQWAKRTLRRLARKHYPRGGMSA